MNPPAGSARNFGLDLLRCFAIGGVIFSHGMYFLYPYVPPLPVGGGRALHLYHLGHAGSYGVELFFVLSGFLIGGILLRLGDRLAAGRGLVRFYVRRWFRTLPNYLVFLAINLVFFAGWSQLPRYLFFLQNLTGNHVTFFPESWSLAIEEWFYLVFPFLVWALLRIGCSRGRGPRPVDAAFLTAGALLYAASTLARIAYAANPLNDWANIQRTVVILRFDALMTGIFAAWLAARRPRLFSSAPGLKALAGLALLGFCYATLYWYHAHNESFFARTFRFNLISLGFALLLPLAVSWRDVRIPGVESFARWSYAMYFINEPLSYWLSHAVFFSRPVHPGQGWLGLSAAEGWVGFASLEVGTVALAAVWYSAFERPTTALRERFARD